MYKTEISAIIKSKLLIETVFCSVSILVPCERCNIKTEVEHFNLLILTKLAEIIFVFS